MNVNKRTLYISRIYAALHTLSGRADNVNLQTAEKLEQIKQPQKRKDDYYLQINPNKVVSEKTMIKSYSEFKRILESTLKEVEVRTFQLNRVDLAFNSDHSEDYELFKKLNRLLICCISQKYDIDNCYESRSLWTLKDLSVAIKGDRIEAENYNKELESKGKTDTKNRLEIRSKRMKAGTSIEDEFLGNWCKRLDQSIEEFENVQERYNHILAGLWFEDKAKPKKEQVFVSETAFLLQYQNCIFNINQLRGLFKKMGFEKPERKAKKFKENHKIEFYSQTDLRVVVKALKKAMQDYFKK